MITREKRAISGFIALPILVLCVDLFTPYLIWQHILPAEIRWLSHLGITIMILITIFRMLVFDYIPRLFLLVFAVIVVWTIVAILISGQGILPTIWGVWLLLQFPLVGLFAYFQLNRPKLLENKIQKYLLSVLILQVAVQLLQYAGGEAVGDNLAGLFGEKGTGDAVIFAILVNCIFLGYWVTTKRWLGLLSVMVLGGLSSVLGEMKLFPFALVISGFLAISIYAVRHRQLRVVVTYTTLIIVIVLGFVNVYNLYVSEANKTPFQTYLTDPVKFSQYMNRFTVYSTSEGRATNIGRGAAVEIGWNSIRREPATLLLGYGLGARSESKTLGTTGVSLTTGYTGFSVGTSLLILMQEMGLVGLIVLSCIILWMIFSLVKSIRNNPSSPANGLRYGLLFCSILLPLWLWYSNAWTMRVPMLLYWYLFGYIFAESHDISLRLLKRASLKLAFYTGNM